ncbi:hypothetical protein EMIT0P74_30154 [Pseudomonas sp. IT-P74]
MKDTDLSQWGACGEELEVFYMVGAMVFIISRVLGYAGWFK